MIRSPMATYLFVLLSFLVSLNPQAMRADNAGKIKDRLQNAALVTKEAMGVRSGVPKRLLDKAFCVIVIPSVIKGAIGFGGSYGRGVMTCRAGEDFKGEWGAPSMISLEGVSLDFSLVDRLPTLFSL